MSSTRDTWIFILTPCQPTIVLNDGDSSVVQTSVSCEEYESVPLTGDLLQNRSDKCVCEKKNNGIHLSNVFIFYLIYENIM